MPKTLRIFAYKNVLAADSDIENGMFINAPLETGQLGCVVDTKNVEITAAAKELIRNNATRESGTFSTLMLTRGDDGTSTVAILGHYKHLLDLDELLSRTCDVSVLDECDIMSDDDIPDDFKEFVDSQQA